VKIDVPTANAAFLWAMTQAEDTARMAEKLMEEKEFNTLVQVGGIKAMREVHNKEHFNLMTTMMGLISAGFIAGRRYEQLLEEKALAEANRRMPS
jgi:hypothetical protein